MNHFDPLVWNTGRELRCEFCHKTNNPPRPAYMFAERQEIFDQTPLSVWEEYRANGYTTAEAISMEFSYL